jgi:hypothetical protein
VDIVSNLAIEPDHIGLYPRKGNADIEGHVPLLYILTIPEGEGTFSISTDHPLTAPIRKQLKDGSPGGNWRYLAEKKGDSHFIFGALTLSTGNRLLFFPSNYDVHVSIRNETKKLDHISLESKSNLRSHYTFRNGSHLSNGPVKDIGSDFSLWFTMFIGDFSQYIPLPNKIQVSIDWPSSDISRFSQEGVLANYNSKSIIEVPTFVDDTPLHQIDFMLAKPDGDISNIPNIVFENIHSLDQPTPTQSGFTKIDVFEGYSLFIRITERNGQLAGDTLIMSTDTE